MEALLRAAVRLCKFMCLSISHSLFDQEMLDLLGRLGFEKTEFGSRIADFRPMILVKSLSYGPLQREWALAGHDLIDVRSWDMRPIYSDGV
jgi:hypothetical protein